MWLVACVRCRLVDCRESQMEARGRAEVHALAYGCVAHTFYWRAGNIDVFRDVHRPGERSTFLAELKNGA